MKRKTLTLLAVVVLGLVSSGFAQLAAHSPSSTRQLGYFDHTTGVFTPLKDAARDSDAAVTTTTVTGTLVFKFTITAKSGVPKNGVVTCEADVEVSGDTSGFTSPEHASGVATLVSGTTYDCTATINYSWPLASASTDKISYTTTAAIEYGYEVTATNGAATVVVPAAERSNTRGSLTSIAVPASGTTTTEDISDTL